MALDECGVIFALVGFVFLGLGLWLRFSESTRATFEFEALNSSEFDMAVTVLIITGSVMLIVVVFGENGALLTFSALVTILAGALVVFGVIANARKEEIGLRYLDNGDPALADILTFIQELLHCCGATGVTSLDFAKETCPDPDSIWEHLKMDACPGVIVDVFNRNAPLVIGLFVGTGVSLVAYG
ncbi:hypothetical protein KUCAC02_007738 [Chaenocephalus aceratus]|uniref:Uncharacterized protein n=1 Tax=Chaenocephalus aceratus TaxID=36190 RepID=A0ACB9X874_CHAAC|nr:hypothetical protein KUCAC02_007738 [Chaenocephalus aceratus]